MFYHSRWLHLFTAIVLVLTSFAVMAPPLTAQTGSITYVVTTNLDTLPAIACATPEGGCSLRQTIIAANEDNQPSIIEFSLPEGSRIITPTSELPPLTANDTTIDGSDGGLFPTIEINGAGILSYGIQIVSANNIIRGLIINNFDSINAPNGVGIYITGPGAQNNRIWANYIGNRPRETAKYSNRRGIQIKNGASGTIIGGNISNSQERNTISGNDLSGIYLTGATNTQIQGNYIGLALNASIVAVPLGNIGPGIEILDSSNSLVGGTATGQRNLISDNGDSPTRGAGILIRGVSTTGTQVLGNYIGTSSNGLSAIPNNGDGIRIQNGATNTVISSGNGLARSVISGNTGYGIRISSASTSGNQLTNNYIGLGSTGATALPNLRGGVRIEDNASNNTVGIGNVISGNNGYGVSVGLTLPTATEVVSNTITGSTIGLNAAGTAAAPNTSGGVLLDRGSRSARIGGASAGERNVISGNTGYGISITGSSDNTVLGNYVGLSLDAINAISNTMGGVLIEPGVRGSVNFDANNNVIGGPSSSAQNVISGNGGSGVVISGANTLTNTISYNIIGLRRSPSTSQFNVAAGNGANGVWIANGARQTDVLTNTIAFNQQSGVLVEDSTSTTIRGGSALTNTTGISVSDSLTTTVRLLFAEGNNQDGIVVGGASRYAPITQNTIRDNGAVGVRVTDTAQRVRITENVITGNGGVGDGIRLDPSTPSGGSATNPNHDIDPPSLLRLNQNLQLTGRVLVDEGDPGSCITCTIHAYTANPLKPDQQGQTLLEFGPSSFIVPDASGLFTATLPLSDFPKQLVLTATDINDNTSEFASFVPTFGLEIAPPLASNAIPSETITYTHRVTNTGSVDLTDLRLQAASTLGWTASVSPTNQFTVRAGESLPVDLGLTLPTGSAPNVRAGLIDETRVTVSSTKKPDVTASLTDTTTVLEKFVLAVSPVQRFGAGRPDTIVPYVHKLTNNGNITRTVSLAATTDRGSNWDTTVTPASVELGPGQTADVTVRVRIPLGAQSNVTATTRVQLTTPDPSQNKVVTDTTRVTLEQLATMTPNREGFAAAGTTINFEHVVENLSNGQATFKLGGGSSLGSKITFRSNTPGVTLAQDNTFTIGNQAGSNQFSFLVEITIPREALPGQRDLVNIFLSDSSGNTIGGATVQDTITVARGQNLPRIWLPVIMR